MKNWVYKVKLFDKRYIKVSTKPNKRNLVKTKFRLFAKDFKRFILQTYSKVALFSTSL